MISPDVIKKIEDKRREKTRSEDQRVPAHRDDHLPQRPTQNPEKQEDPDKTPGRSIEISMV